MSLWASHGFDLSFSVTRLSGVCIIRLDVERRRHDRVAAVRCDADRRCTATLAGFDVTDPVRVGGHRLRDVARCQHRRRGELAHRRRTIARGHAQHRGAQQVGPIMRRIERVAVTKGRHEPNVANRVLWTCAETSRLRDWQSRAEFHSAPHDTLNS